MKLTDKHIYEVGHYYKRTYDDGEWIIFTINKINNCDSDYDDYRLDVSTLFSSSKCTRFTRMMRSFPDATTIELEYAQVVSMVL